MRWRSSASSWIVATLIGAAAQPLAMAAARADAYSCRVPRAILCEGCAKAIAITLLRDGSCRISFTSPASAADSGVPAPQPTEINFQVDVAPAPRLAGGASRIARRTHAAERFARRVSWLRAAPQAHCFIFNDQRYCE